MNIDTAVAAKDLQETLINFPEIYSRLKNGEFITRHHHALFKEVRDNQDAYTTIFNMIGEDLKYHKAGFYRLEGEEQAALSERSKLYALVAFCLIEQIGDSGLDPIQVIDAQTTLNEDFLDKLVVDQNKHLSKMNLHHRADFQKIVTSMVKAGIFADSQETYNSGIVLYPSFHIYIDACKTISEQKASNSEENNA